VISGLFLPKQLTRVPASECPLPLPQQARVTPALQPALLALEVIESKSLWQPDL